VRVEALRSASRFADRRDAAAGYESVLHYGIVAPAGTPRPIIDRLNGITRGVMARHPGAHGADGSEPLASSGRLCGRHRPRGDQMVGDRAQSGQGSDHERGSRQRSTRALAERSLRSPASPRRHAVRYVPDAGHQILIDRSLATRTFTRSRYDRGEGVALAARRPRGKRAVLLMQSSGSATASTCCLDQGGGFRSDLVSMRATSAKAIRGNSPWGRRPSRAGRHGICVASSGRRTHPDHDARCHGVQGRRASRCC